jgi:hypothetical protein
MWIWRLVFNKLTSPCRFFSSQDASSVLCQLPTYPPKPGADDPLWIFSTLATRLDQRLTQHSVLDSLLSGWEALNNHPDCNRVLPGEMDLLEWIDLVA